MDLKFESDRLKFHPIEQDDIDIIIDLWTNPNVIKYLGGRYTEQQLKDEHHLIMRRCGDGCIGIWIITTKSGNEKIGTVILLPMPVHEDDTDWDLVVGDNIPDCEIEVGYILKETAWGKGYATEACKRLLKFAFEESPLTDIIAVIDEENSASQNVLLKSGLQPIGLVDAYAEKCPGFRITKEQWQKAAI